MGTSALSAIDFISYLRHTRAVCQSSPSPFDLLADSVLIVAELARGTGGVEVRDLTQNLSISSPAH